MQRTVCTMNCSGGKKACDDCFTYTVPETIVSDGQEYIRRDLVAALSANTVQGNEEALRVVPEGMIDRIKSAQKRIQDNHAPRRIPADPTDVDLVLVEVEYFLTGKWPPFWIHAAPQPDQKG